jgi:endonuclease I
MYDDVSSASKTFSNGSKLGNGTIYSSKTTFEIADVYKGDIAIGYFYMAIRYSDKISSWSAGEVKNVFSSSYPYLTQNAIKVFTKWAHEDLVSDKEIL